MLFFFFFDDVGVSLHTEIQFVELAGIDLAWRLCQEALASLCLWECNDVPDIFRSCQQHNEPVESEGNPPVGRRPVFECFEEEAESHFGFFSGDVEQVEYLLLLLGVMNTNASAAYFRAVDDDVVGL